MDELNEGEWEKCFLCLKDVVDTTASAPKRQKLKNDSGSWKKLEVLLKYLLDTSSKRFDAIRDKLLGLLFGKTGLGFDGKGKRNYLQEEEPECSSSLRICDSCESRAENLMDLHVELEGIQKRIIQALRPMREAISKNLDRPEKLLEFSDKSLIDTLADFQGAVYQKGKGSNKIPLEVLEKSAYFNRVKKAVTFSEPGPVYKVLIKSEPQSDEECANNDDDSNWSPAAPAVPIDDDDWNPSSTTSRKRNSRKIRPQTKRRTMKHSQSSKSKFSEADRRKSRYFKCDYCEFTAKYSFKFEEHLKIEHELNEKNFRCDYDNCTEEFTTEQYYQHHQSRHKLRNIACDLCSELFSIFDLPEHFKTHEDATVLHCAKCSFCCATGERYVKHITDMHYQKDWPCSICGKICSTRQQFLNHLSENHSAILMGKWKCDVCGKECSSMRQLKDHKIRDHVDHV